MIETTHHRLEGLRPDNLLAFLALMGLLRVLEIARPAWRARVAWERACSPIRPVLNLRVPQLPESIAQAAAEGVAELAKDHDFDRGKLAFQPEEARARLMAVAALPISRQRETARLWSSLLSDAAIRKNKEFVERTPFCLLDVAQTAFLKNLHEIALDTSTPRKGRKQLSVAETIQTALFTPWARAFQTTSFRWDPTEDSRHALRWSAPTDDKQGVEHGANVLAAFGLRSLTAVPFQRGSEVRLSVAGGRVQAGEFWFAWPIWEEPASLASVEAMLNNPALWIPDGLAYLGVREVRVAEKFNPGDGKYSNFGRGRPLEKQSLA